MSTSPGTTEGQGKVLQHTWFFSKASSHHELSIKLHRQCSKAGRWESRRGIKEGQPHTGQCGRLPAGLRSTSEPVPVPVLLSCHWEGASVSQLFSGSSAELDITTHPNPTLPVPPQEQGPGKSNEAAKPQERLRLEMQVT